MGNKVSRPIIVCIEGNIGVGKSTLIQNLKKQIHSSRVIYFCEPVNTVWKEPLQHMYKNPQRWHVLVTVRLCFYT